MQCSEMYEWNIRDEAHKGNTESTGNFSTLNWRLCMNWVLVLKSGMSNPSTLTVNLQGVLQMLTLSLQVFSELLFNFTQKPTNDGTWYTSKEHLK